MEAESIHITKWGQSGPRVVMVHGSAQGSRVGGDGHFRVQEGLGDRGWQIVVPDRPGHGRSPSRGLPDDAEIDGAWVADLLGEGAHLVGHSFGGCVALAAAAKRPSAVYSLTLIEPAMQKLAIQNADVRKFVFKLLMIRTFSLSAAKRARRFRQLLRIPEEIGGAKTHEELIQMGRALARLRVPSKHTLQLELAHIKDCKIPLLVVTGGWSSAIEATADAAAKAGEGRRVVVSSQDHFPQQASGEFNQVLARFMSQNDGNKVH